MGARSVERSFGKNAVKRNDDERVRSLPRPLKLQLPARLLRMRRARRPSATSATCACAAAPRVGSARSPPSARAMDAEADAGSVVSGLSGGDGAGAGPADEDREMEGAPGCSGSRSLPFEFERSRSESSGDEDDEDDEEEEMEEEELEGDSGVRFGTDDGELDSDDDREVKKRRGVKAGER